MFYKIVVLISKLYALFLLRGFAHIGKNTLIKPVLNSMNRDKIFIGDDVNIGSFSWISVSTHFGGEVASSEEKIRLRINNNVDIGNNAFIVPIST